MPVTVYRFLALVFGFTLCDSANILTVLGSDNRIDFLMFQPLLKALVSRGHNVTVVRFQYHDKITNADVAFSESKEISGTKLTWEYIKDIGIFGQIGAIADTLTKTCEHVMKNEKMYQLMNSEIDFDLILTHHSSSDCFLAYGQRFNASVINIVTSVAPPWLNDRIGNPDNPAYIPNYFLPFSNRMSFMQRVINTVINEISKRAINWYCDSRLDELIRKKFGENVPSLEEMRKKTSLVLVNSHFTLSYPRPLVPVFVEVGGLHVTTGRRLPRDLKLFLDNAKEGAIYFSLGSAFETSSLPMNILNVFKDAFAQIPQHVLWKAENITYLPKNVNTSNWYPQQEILHHPNVKLFITHGGLMGIIEAVNAGVPMVGLPLINDQSHNVEMCVQKKIAVGLDINTITTEKFLSAIKTVIRNPSYHKNARDFSELFKDRPQTPLDTAVFWTEYVIRHEGAAFLRSAAVDLPLYQYLLLDIIALIALVAIMAIIIIYYFLKTAITLSYELTNNFQNKAKPNKKTD